MFQQQIKEVQAGIREQSKKREVLRKLDLFVLDNSLRETTVGQLRGHTIENKWKIYEQVKKVGFKHMIVASFSHMTRLGDTFIKELKAKGEDMSLLYAFTEFLETINKDRVPNVDDVPIGLLKMKELGIKNVVMELDLVYNGIDYTKFNAKQMCKLISKRLEWIFNNLSRSSRVFVNIRDLPDAMKQKPHRVFKIVNYLSSLPAGQRLSGIVFEESGKYLPEELGVWTAAVRKEMDRCGFKEGHLLVHVHEQWGMQDITALECLANGANGIWAGLCVEGASMGHACSTVTLMNLVRLGNQRVLKNFNCTALRNAAQVVTRVTTGLEPAPKQPIYGGRALDMVFGMDQFTPNKKDFSMAAFFGEEPVMRMTTLASPAMIVTRLTNVFGADKAFTEDRAKRMLEVMLEDLHQERKEEYMSAVGLAMLYDRSGGKLTPKMSDVIAKTEPRMIHIRKLIAEVREMWDEWDLRDETKKDESLEFDSFYNGFMAPYFGCYRCAETKMALKAIDMDSDGKVDWKEFELYLKWAGRQYPQTEDAETLLTTAFRKGLIPAMQDEVVKQADSPSATESADVDYCPDADDDADFLRD